MDPGQAPGSIPVPPGGQWPPRPPQGGLGSSFSPPPKKRKKWLIPLIIVLVLACVVTAVVVVSRIMSRSISRNNQGQYVLSDDSQLNFRSPYIGEIHIESEISKEGGTGAKDYRHQFLMDLVDQMENDSQNRGILIYMDTPGGDVYPTDEFYLKLMEYKEKTGRPIYTYMASEAASGGYYIASASDKIFANRNCWTGSIGVYMGTIYDTTGLLEKLGVKTVTIHSGKNKLMGHPTEKLTKEQQAILQSVIDEAYNQFVGVVAKGRGLPFAKAEALADGRIYTAAQAQRIGLVDQVGSLADCKKAMQAEKAAQGAQVKDMIHEENTASLSSLAGLLGKSLKKDQNDSKVSEVKELVEMNGKVDIQYMSFFRK